MTGLPAAPAVLTVDVEEWFHAPFHPSASAPEAWVDLPSVLDRGMERTLALLEHLGVRGTFFVLGWVAQRHPALICRLAGAGHELGSHGWDHRRAEALGPQACAEQAARTAALLEDLTGAPVTAYRAPCWSLPDDPRYYAALAARGLRLSSSCFDGRRWGEVEGVLEVPALGVGIGGLRVPLGGTVALRLLPAAWTGAWSARTRRSGRPALFWFHPWELVPEGPRVRGGAAVTWARHAGLARLPEQLGRLLGPEALPLSQAAPRVESPSPVR